MKRYLLPVCSCLLFAFAIFATSCGYSYSEKRDTYRLNDIIHTPAVSYKLVKIEKESVTIKEFESHNGYPIRKNKFFQVILKHRLSLGNNTSLHLNKIDVIGQIADISLLKLEHSGYFTLPP